ncbi:unnamed protein product, partial [Scytosiphon promiscuus]
SGKEKINVALHAQSNYAIHGWVAGSEVTTSGLRRAFETLGCVRTCEVFAPFSYSGLSSRKWNLVVIEGFTGSVPAFIHEVRAGNANAVVLFYCLDTYPSLSVVGNLDVDAFLTNSRLLLPLMKKASGFIAPASSLIHLAADPGVMLEVPFRPEYGHNVVYLGQFEDTKHRLAETLKEVAPYGLAIYGNGWDSVGAEDLLPFWRGILPLKDIASLYSSAKVVLSTTETLQRGLGMVNNRVFEALACGCAVLSDAFPEMEETFGDHILYYRHPGDAARAVEYLLGNDTARTELGSRGRKLVLSKHTYASRVQSILSTMGDVLSSRAREASDAGADAGGGGAGGPRGREPRSGGAGGSRAGIVAAVAEVEVPGAAPRAHHERTRRFGSGADLDAVVPARSLESCTTPGTAATFLGREEEDESQSDGYPAAALSSSGRLQVEERRSGGCLGSGGASQSPSAEATPKSGNKQQHLRVTALVEPAGDVDGAPDEARGACDRVLEGPAVPFLPPSQASSSKPFAGCTRPNAPTILVVYRSGCPMPVRLRRDLESGVDRTAGGARMGFVGVSEAARGAGEGSEEEEVWRLKSLETGLSRLLAAANAGADTPALKLLGDEAASEAAGFMEWCCSVGMVVVYAKVGDPLEKYFLHPLAEETAHRVVRTAFFVACSGGGHADSTDGCGTIPGRSLDSTVDRRRTDRYDWVQQFSDPSETKSISGGTPSRLFTSSKRSCGGGRAQHRKLRRRSEPYILRMSRQAAIYLKKPRDGTLLAVRQRRGEGVGDWAEVDLVVEVECPFFRAPDDGMWCVLLDGVEVGCRGDHDPQEATIAGSRHSLAITVQVTHLAVPRRATVHAVLKGGRLERVRAMRQSAPVSVSLW